MTAPVLFQSMPPLSPEEYEALTDSIRRHGVQVPIVVDESGVVIDGHHRKAIAQSLGVHCPQTRIFGKSDTEKRTLALTLNLDRRNLSREQRRAIVEASLKADPQLSDRAHAQRTGVDHKTVGATRQRMEARGESPHVATERIDLTTGEVITDVRGGTVPPSPVHDVEEQDTDDSQPSPAPRPASIVGLDGKTYSRPEPRTPARSPLRDGFRDAALDLDKVVRRFERLVTDDRYPKNRDEVARYANDLIRARDALDQLIGQMATTTTGKATS